MSKKAWSIELEDGEHVVELDHGFCYVDGSLIEKTAKNRLLFDIVRQHTFKINDHECTIVIGTKDLAHKRDFFVDGISVTTGEPISSPEPMPA